MTAAVLDRASSPAPSHCRFSWCAGMYCSPSSNDSMHAGRPSEIRDEHHDYDVSVRPMFFDFDDDTVSGPIVELVINDADNGCGVCVNLNPADAYELSAVLVAAGNGKAPRGKVVTVHSEPGGWVSGGTVTVELLDESFDMVVGLSVRDLRIPLVKISVEGDGETKFEECKVFDSCARDLGRFMQLAAYEVKQ